MMRFAQFMPDSPTNVAKKNVAKMLQKCCKTILKPLLNLGFWVWS
jgi:hypothetical protein